MQISNRMRTNEPEWGKRYREPPTKLPLKEPGEPFHFRYGNRYKIMDEVADRSEFPAERMTIYTTSPLDWDLDQYILIGEELWKVLEIPEIKAEKQQGYSRLRIARQTYTLSLAWVENPLELRTQR